MRCRHTATGLCLILVLICALAPKHARADEGSQAKYRRLDANLTFGPIGKVAWNSLGRSSVEINGRMARAEQVIWNGDLIEVTGDNSARVLLDSLGQVALKSGAQVRLATTIAKLADNFARPVLVAELVSGDLAVNLQQEAVAYIEAGGSVFSTTPGARFRIGVWEGRPVIEMARGDVSIEQQRRTRIKPRDVQVRPGGTLVEVATVGGVSTVPLNTKTNKRTPDRIRWMKSLEAGGGGTFTLVAFRGSPIGTQTAPDETPVGNRLVKFDVVPNNLATIQSTNITNADGYVPYTFVAGGNPGTGRIIATIAPDQTQDPADTIYETYSRDFNIEKLGFWRLRTKILIAIAAVGVGCVVGCHRRSGPIQQQPPPTIP
ncbi:MAG: hypothetical protein AABO57_23685 [Acidobacteriota bacterium]